MSAQIAIVFREMSLKIKKKTLLFAKFLKKKISAQRLYQYMWMRNEVDYTLTNGFFKF